MSASELHALRDEGQPMKVDDATVRHIARLARIRVSDAEAKTLESELTGILQWVKQLEEVDTQGVEPMTCVTEMSLKMRNDEVSDGGYPDEIVRNAPDHAGSFFTVPKVVE
jgi:aspartyl-tRNA(Asn)/glutamyl-tRNA(Gln) amidotransferase subunit C